jgi:hypothetical protein
MTARVYGSPHSATVAKATDEEFGQFVCRFATRYEHRKSSFSIWSEIMWNEWLAGLYQSNTSDKHFIVWCWIFIIPFKDGLKK